MLTKTCAADVKLAGSEEGLADGQFTAIVSVFGNKDSYGDIVQKGAFKATLADWKASGDPIPCYFSHRMDDPDYNIGHVVEAHEAPEGLWVKVQLDLESTTSKAGQVYRLLKGRRLTQFSFAYDVIDGGFETMDDDEFYAIRQVRLYEVGPTPIGANQETELLDVKAATDHAALLARSVKSGRVLSSKNEGALQAAHQQLSAAVQQIADVLATVASGSDDQEKNAQPQQPSTEHVELAPPTSDPATADGPAVEVEPESPAESDLAVLQLMEREFSDEPQATA